MRYLKLFENWHSMDESDIRLIVVIPKVYLEKNQAVLRKTKWIRLGIDIRIFFGSIGEDLHGYVYISPFDPNITEKEFDDLKLRAEEDSNYVNFATINLKSYDRHDMLNFEHNEHPHNVNEYEKVEILNFLNIKNIDERTDKDIEILQQIYPVEMKEFRGKIAGKKFGF